MERDSLAKDCTGGFALGTARRGGGRGGVVRRQSGQAGGASGWRLRFQ